MGRIFSQKMVQGSGDFSGSKLQVLINDGTGNFIDETDSRIPNQLEIDDIRPVYFLRAIDFEGDGDLDILSTVVSPLSNQPILWLNDGGGVFTDGTIFVSGFQNGITAVHLNEDGLPDYVSIDFYGASDGSQITTAISQGASSPQWMGGYDIDFIDAGSQNDRITPLRGDDIVTGGAGLISQNPTTC